jgi:hypothetical protein
VKSSGASRKDFVKNEKDALVDGQEVRHETDCGTYLDLMAHRIGHHENSRGCADREARRERRKRAPR